MTVAEDIQDTENQLAYWRNLAITERRAKLEIQSNYVVMTLIAICLAGVIVVMAYAKWRAGL
jgi:hypothetical protein